MSGDALFELSVEGPEEVFRPLPLSHSGWGNKLLRGMAVTALLARGSETTAHAMDLPPAFHPARFTVDLFRPAPAVDSRLSTTVVRQGRRLCVIDSALVQDNIEVARSSTVWVREQAPPDGAVWSQDESVLPGIPDLQPASEDRRVMYVQETGWTQVDDAPDTPGRRGTWHLPVPIVLGEQPTGFVAAACVADVANVVSNWGNAGLGYINADVSMSLSRVPDPHGMGLFALDRLESQGTAIGTTALFDRRGRCGTVTTVAVANASKAVDPRTRSARNRARA